MSAAQQILIRRTTPPLFESTVCGAGLSHQHGVLRPTNISDLTGLQDYYRAMSAESRRLRLHASMPEVPASVLQLYKGADPHSIAGFTLRRSEHDNTIIGEGILARSTNSLEGELGVSIADSEHGRGWGRLLITQLMAHAVQTGYRSLLADTLWDNARFIGIASSLGFSRKRHPDDCNLIRMTFALAPTG